MEVDAVSGALSPEDQIRCAVVEAMENIFRAILGENWEPKITYTIFPVTLEGHSNARTEASVGLKTSSRTAIRADIPIRYPDAECLSYRVDSRVFPVELGAVLARSSIFEAWCGHNMYEGAKVIVREVYSDGRERWRIADSLEQEVLYRGPYADMPWWAKQIVAQKWSHLPHVRIDTETSAMILFVSHKVPDGMTSMDD